MDKLLCHSYLAIASSISNKKQNFRLGTPKSLKIIFQKIRSFKFEIEIKGRDFNAGKREFLLFFFCSIFSHNLAATRLLKYYYTIR